MVTYQNLLVLSIKNLAGVQRVPSNKISTFHKWYCPIVNDGFSVDSPPSPTDIIQSLRQAGFRSQQNSELIIDEGQDLPRSVYESIPTFFSRVFVGADNGQQVHKNHGARMEDIESSLDAQFAPFRRFALGRNFRNTYETYLFARQFIPRTNRVAWDKTILERLLRADRRGHKPTVISYRNVTQRNTHLQTTLRNAEGNVGVLCPMGPVPNNKNNSAGSVDQIYGLISSMGFRASRYHYKTGIPNELERIIVTTFKSAKGLEFDTVIIPCINYWKAIPEEWYVASTRARGRLFIYRDLTDPQSDPISSFDGESYDAESADINFIPGDDDLPF